MAIFLIKTHSGKKKFWILIYGKGSSRIFHQYCGVIICNVVIYSALMTNEQLGFFSSYTHTEPSVFEVISKLPWHRTCYRAFGSWTVSSYLNELALLSMGLKRPLPASNALPTDSDKIRGILNCKISCQTLIELFLA